MFPTTTFTQCRASFDSQCSHLLRLKPLPEPSQRQSEVELTRLKNLFFSDSGNDVVKLHIIGVYNEH
ncbi:hypothetical protein Hanom_Chr07g00647971 [Helianthus anomalus]